MRRTVPSASMEILDPRVPFDDHAAAPTFDLGRPLAGVTVGLRLDRTWRCYDVVVDAWQSQLTADGAAPRVLVTGERVGDPGERTRADVDEWSRLVDCGVIGLGN